MSIFIGLVVGFGEEFIFRGFLPAVLTVKLGLPVAAAVVISSAIFGVRMVYLRVCMLMRVNRGTPGVEAPPICALHV